MSPSKTNKAGASNSVGDSRPIGPRGRRRRSGNPPKPEGPNARRTIRALAMLANAAHVVETQKPNLDPNPNPILNPNPNPNPIPNPIPNHVPNPEVPGIAVDFMGAGQNGVVNPDLNDPPIEAAPGEAKNHVQPQLAPNAPAFIPGGIPFYFAFQQAGLGNGVNLQNSGMIPFNYNGGFPPYTVRVRSLNLHDAGVIFHIGLIETFYAIYREYASRADLQREEIVIKKGNDVLLPSITALAAGINDGDVLSVEPLNHEHNVDTRIKQFQVRDLVTNPRIITVRALPQETLLGIYRLWGGQNNVDPMNIIAFYENNVVTSMHTVREIGIKNNHVLFVLPNNWRNVKTT